MAEPLRAVPAHSTADPGILLAQNQEDLVVGDELVRFRFYTRVVHWGVALTFFLCLFTGLPIWTPIFGWLAPLVGGLQVCRWLHPWSGIAFAVFALLQFVHWAGEMKMTPADKRFTKLGGFLAYLRWETHDEEIGKYNGGQKALFWLSSLASLALLATGVVMWWPEYFSSTPLREASWVLHDATFILFTLMIFGHIYLAIAEPGTFSAMVKGTVSKAWARLHHPAWYRDVSGDSRR
ncbi:MAG TPA: formate dehydrogenase subunit gamma [Myxococcaceae bacterium]|nr:formate dehydrogenase subunit gamma [Myxococcaceae bacterium]